MARGEGLPVRSHAFVLLVLAVMVAACASTDRGSRGLDEATARGESSSSGYDVRRGADASSTWVAENAVQAFTTRFDPRGVAVIARAGAWAWSMRLAAVGREGAMRAVTDTEPVASGARVEYERGDGWLEWYVNTPAGVEQGFTVRERPAGPGAVSRAPDARGRSLGDRRRGPVQIELESGGDLAPHALANRVELRDANGAHVLSYGKLAVRDAHGRALEASISIEGARLVLRVDDADAEYPIVVDPLVWAKEAVLVGSDTAAGDGFGKAVTVSGDTAIVGADAAFGGASSSGAAYVFVGGGAAWTQQQKLAPLDPASGDGFGAAVAISGDTAVVGAFKKNTSTGAAYVFVRSGAAWTQQQKLVASDGVANDFFGVAVSISGNTIVIGARGKDAKGPTRVDAGGAYVFVRAGTVWTEQAKLAASDAVASDFFGNAVAVDVDTVVVGASRKTTSTGAVYAFVRSGTAWSQQAKLTASDAATGDGFGASVALGGDTAFVGAPGKSASTGAAYAFLRTGALWSEQAKLVASDPTASRSYGNAVALSGSTAIVGTFPSVGGGAAYVVTRAGVTWTEQAKVAAAYPVASVAVSGAVAVVGAPVACCIGQAFVVAGGEPNGTPCTVATAAQCASAICQDGACCDLACTGQCEACDVAGSVGACSLVTGTPRGSRAACTGTNVGTDCGPSCNGDVQDPNRAGPDRKACRYPINGALCSAVACADGWETKPSACDGIGHCQDVPRKCAPYACGATACKSKCTGDADCAATFVCDKCFGCAEGVCTLPDSGQQLGSTCLGPGSCAAGMFCTEGVCCASAACPAGSSCAIEGSRGACMKLRGTACTSGLECGSGFCADGVCCTSACEAQCQACDVAGSIGVCTGVKGKPHGDRPPCDDGAGDVCQAKTCDGAADPTTCAALANGPETACRPATCEHASFTAAAYCSGAGQCAVPLPSRCDPFACDDTRPDKGCRTTCSRSEECAPGFACRNGTCAQGAKCSEDRLSSLGEEDGAPTPCTPYRCDTDGRCGTRCATADDCAPGFACRDKVCESGATAAPVGDGCQLGAIGARSTPGLAVALGMLGLALARRTRRERGHARGGAPDGGARGA